MALDRLAVTRTDFPMSRRGYDRIAVDRHLDEIARQIDGLQRPSVGSTASAQVQSILDAAEASAAEIERRAWEEATRVHAAADEALARARGQVLALGDASRVLRDRIEGLLAEVETLEGTLDGMVAEPGGAQDDPQDTMAFDPILDEDEQVAEQPAPGLTPQAPVMREPRFGRDPGEDARTGWFSQGPPACTAAAVSQQAGSQEARESARLVALNMADGGQPREVTDAYLSELYAPEERAALLDEIYGGR